MAVSAATAEILYTLSVWEPMAVVGSGQQVVSVRVVVSSTPETVRVPEAPESDDFDQSTERMGPVMSWTPSLETSRPLPSTSRAAWDESSLMVRVKAPTALKRGTTVSAV
jgi:hypothetical protein